MEITIENKKYQLNVERAKELGVIKEVAPVVKDFSVGDVYAHPTFSGGQFIIGSRTYEAGCYMLLGMGKTLVPYTNFGKDGATHEQMINFINDCVKSGFRYMGNINSHIEKALMSMGVK